MTHDVRIETVPARLVAATRRHTTHSRVGEDIGSGFVVLTSVLARDGVTGSGPPLVLYHGELDDQVGTDVEICLPVDGPVTGSADVSVREIEGGTVVTTEHRGPYPGVGSAYQDLMAWIAEHRARVTGPPREIYLNDPATVPAEEILTRIEFPVETGTA